MFKTPPLHLLLACISDPSSAIGARMRSCYHLKQVYNLAETSDDDKVKILETLCREVSVDEHGQLMRHEIAYVLGQLRDERAVPSLMQVVEDKSANCIVRHEAAEAIGAIGCADAVPALKREALDGSNPLELRETIDIAVNFIDWRVNGDGDERYVPMACACMTSPYDSTDPAPPHPDHEKLTYKELGDIIRDEGRPLFERYRCMFSLRNRGGEHAAVQLGEALVLDKASALFRHEVCVSSTAAFTCCLFIFAATYAVPPLCNIFALFIGIRF